MISKFNNRSSIRRSTLLYLPCFLYSLVIITATAKAQQPTQKTSSILQFSPVKLIDPVNPGLELSYEIKYNTRSASQITLTYQHSFLPLKTFSDYGGFKTAFEQKYYLKEEKDRRVFVSAELAWSKVHYTTSSDFLQDAANPSSKYTDSFRIDKKNITVNFKYGFQFIAKRFTIEFSGGLGIKHKNVTRSGLINPGAYELKPVDLNAYQLSDRAGEYFILNVPVVFRIGLRL